LLDAVQCYLDAVASLCDAVARQVSSILDHESSHVSFAPLFVHLKKT
jgi:hypothetical protein